MRNLLFLFGFVIVATGQAQIFEWGQVRGNDVRYLQSHSDSTIIQLGGYSDSLTISGVDEEYAFQGATGSYLAKINPEGEAVWATQLHGYVRMFELDEEDNIYVAGLLYDTLHFSGSLHDTTLISSNESRAFVARYSPAGDFEWAVKLEDMQYVTDMALDPNGNCFVVGDRDVELTFYYSPGEYYFYPSQLMSIAKVSPEGEMQWEANSSQGSLESQCRLNVTGIDTDNDGNVYVTANGYGAFYLPAYMDLGEFDYLFEYGCLILKYDGNAGLMWHHAFSVSSDHAELYGIAAHANKTTFSVIGKYAGGFNLQDQPAEVGLPEISDQKFFLARFDTAGVFSWAEAFGSSNSDFGPWNSKLSITTDAEDNIFVAGMFDASGDFDPGENTYILNYSDGSSFIAKYDSVGQFVWVKNTGGQYSEYGGKLTTDNDGSVYLAGKITEVSSFDIGNPNATLTPEENGSTGFLVKYSVDLLLNTAAGRFEKKAKVFPNPSRGNFSVLITDRDERSTQYFITDLRGRIVRTGIFSDGAGSLDLSGNPGGIYFLHVSGRTVRLVKQ